MTPRSTFVRTLLAVAALAAFTGAALADQLDDVRAAKKVRIAIDLG